MSKEQQLDFSDAEFVLAAANTPLFVLRKLRKDRLVITLAQTFEKEELFRRMRAALRAKLRSHTDVVRPYVYLVALSMKGDLSYLNRAQKIPAKKHKWFGYIANFLADEFVPTSQLKVYANTRLRMEAARLGTAATTNSTNSSTDLRISREEN